MIDELNKMLAQAIRDFAAGQGHVVDTGDLPTWEIGEITHADLTTAWPLKAARLLKQSPVDIAGALVNLLSKELQVDGIATVVAVPPGYINLQWVDEWLINKVSSTHRPFRRERSTVIVEYSSPNVAKPLGIGHIRSTIIGESLARIHEFVGERVVRLNHPGDWGTQFGKLIVMIKDEWGGTISSKRTIQDFVRLYVDFHDRAKQEPELEVRAREETVKLQQKDRINTRIWKLICQKSYKEFVAVYKRLDVRFDQTRGESTYEKELPRIIARAKQSGVAVESDGALIIPMDEFPSPMMIQKSDGAYLYATTDLAALEYREKRYRPRKILYVVGSQQALHFKQLKKAATLLGIAPEDHVQHIHFGMLLGENHKKLSTREGSSIELDGVLDEAVRRAEAQIQARGSSRSWSVRDLSGVARCVGIGAVKYNDLSQHRNHDVVLHWDRMLSLTGNSAPYLQYSVVRIQSILAQARGKAGRSKRGASYPLEPIERVLLRELHRFPLVVRMAATTNEPHRVADILFAIASTFHQLYEQLPVLNAESNARAFRLLLISETAKTVTQGLHLLGIQVPRRM